MLLRLLRGGGRKALSGMRPRSGNLIRPLLAVPKSELLAYLAHKRIPFCHDSSNDDPRFLRNRIRQHLLPLLERDYDPGVREALLNTAGNLAEDVRSIMLTLGGTDAPDGRQLIDSVTTRTRPYWVDYRNTQIHRYVATYQVTSRLR